MFIDFLHQDRYSSEYYVLGLCSYLTYRLNECKRAPHKPILIFGKDPWLHLLGNKEGSCNCFHFWRGGKGLLYTFVNWIGTDEQPGLLFLYLSGNLPNYSSHFLQKIKTISFPIFHVLGNIMHSFHCIKWEKRGARDVCHTPFPKWHFAKYFST